MLKLDDFYHLPSLDALIPAMAAGPGGLIVVAGLDPRLPAQAAESHGLLPSGRAAIFRVMMRALLDVRPDSRCVVVTEGRDSLRIPRHLRDRADVLEIGQGYGYAELIAVAARRETDLVVLDRLDPETVPPALDAASKGARILSHLDTIFQGADVAAHLRDLGALPEQMTGLRWVVSVQRMPSQCPNCRQPVAAEPDQIARLGRVFPALIPHLAGGRPLTFFRATGCERCNRTGRAGDVALFDVFHVPPDVPTLDGERVLPGEVYALELALQGALALEDVLDLRAERLRRLYRLLETSEREAVDAGSALRRKLAELEASNHVLEERTRALVSLQHMGNSLITSTDLDGLAAQICRHVRELCSADRAIFYLRRSERQAEILAVSGWEAGLRRQRVGLEALEERSAHGEPTPFNQWPPGVTPRHEDVEGARLRAGLHVPLLAQQRQVGFLVIHSTRKNRFRSAEVALLQIFANQAALAVQRAELFDQLRTKISQLEAAQVELAEKERLERELELARQVQQSVLPRTFPDVPGYTFAARNVTARRVGGDFYDAFQLEDGRFGVAIADVSGKGLPAALYMALTRSLLLAEARRESAPSAVLGKVNDLLQELGQPNMFVTIFYGIVEQATGRMTYARAGHDRPLLLRGGAAYEIDCPGMALGLFPTPRIALADAGLQLQPGDRLVLYTDGMTDLQNPAGALYDRERFTAVASAFANQPAAGLCEGVFAALAEYQADAEQFDDMTLLVLGVD